MQVFRGIPPVAQRRPCVLTIGNFDGVHRGHQALLAHVRAEANAHRLPTCVLTFEPHPREFFNPAQAPARIAGLRDKLAGLQRCEVNRVIVQRFDAAFASLSAHDFIEHIIVNGLRAQHLWIGDDFRFGKGRAGDFALLQAAGAQYGFNVRSMAAHLDHAQRVSSSRIRAALQSGDLAQAERLLGRPYTISGHVQHGAKLGRTLGFPTLNLRINHHRPAAQGIFVVRVHGLAAQPLPGVASLGLRPTVDASGRMLLEVHVFDFHAEVYGKLVAVELLHKLRDEEKYATLNALQAQIEADAHAARAWLSRHS